MKKQLYIIVLIISLTENLHSFDSRFLFNPSNTTSKYQFIEKKFITDITESKNDTWSKILIAIPASICIFSGLESTEKESNDTFFKSLLKPKLVNEVICASSIAVLTGAFFQHHIAMHANQDAVRDFFTNWDKNQSHTPDELFESFQKIADTIEKQGETFIKKHADEVVKTIQFIITRHFEKRYEKFLQITAYSGLTESKTISEVLKNFVSGAKDLAG